jgi:multidrug efflux pump subunit AcrB
MFIPGPFRDIPDGVPRKNTGYRNVLETNGKPRGKEESSGKDTTGKYSLEDTNADELNMWAPKLVEKLQSLPELRDFASDQQTEGLQTSLIIDRDTASRLGVSLQTIDDTLYDAFGQRIVSTMFTQLNQYHVGIHCARSVVRELYLPDHHPQPTHHALYGARRLSGI